MLTAERLPAPSRHHALPKAPRQPASSAGCPQAHRPPPAATWEWPCTTHPAALNAAPRAIGLCARCLLPAQQPLNNLCRHISPLAVPVAISCCQPPAIAATPAPRCCPRLPSCRPIRGRAIQPLPAPAHPALAAARSCGRRRAEPAHRAARP